MPLSRIVAMAMGLGGALTASQAPEFAQQYAQRLGGAVDELATIVERFDESAARSGLAREEALDRLARNADALARDQGADARRTIERLERLERHRDRLRGADDLSRVLAVLSEPDPQIARRTYLDFRPAAPLSAEGLVFAAAGFALLWLATFGAGKGIKAGAKAGAALARSSLEKRRALPARARGGPRVYRRDDP